MGGIGEGALFSGVAPLPWKGLQSEGQIQDSLYWTGLFPRLVFGRIGFRCTRTGGAI
jgi:hypothetical protein